MSSTSLPVLALVLGALASPACVDSADQESEPQPGATFAVTSAHVSRTGERTTLTGLVNGVHTSLDVTIVAPEPDTVFHGPGSPEYAVPVPNTGESEAFHGVGSPEYALPAPTTGDSEAFHGVGSPEYALPAPTTGESEAFHGVGSPEYALPAPGATYLCLPLPR
jgi:hypothetical protein